MAGNGHTFPPDIVWSSLLRLTIASGCHRCITKESRTVIRPLRRVSTALRVWYRHSDTNVNTAVGKIFLAMVLRDSGATAHRS